MVFRKTLPTDYFALLRMYSIAALMSSFGRVVPAFGGMAPLPLMTEASSASLSCLNMGSHFALSPSYGGILLWQAEQLLSYTALPSAAAA
jgi:hypothetical protein